MKLHADKPDQHAVTAYGDGWITISGQRYTGSVVVGSFGEIRDWGVSRFEDLAEPHFASLVDDTDLAPELVILGSGSRLRFVPPALLRPLIERRIGVETMDTAAACRTFNILAGEGRKVVAALLIEG